MSGFENDVMYAKNADFTQLDNQNVSENNGLITNGQLWIGTTSVNAGGTHINVGTLVSPDSSITFGYSSPNLTATVSGGTTTGKTVTGDTGGALAPTAGNWNFLMATSANSTTSANGTASTLRFTLSDSLANTILGSNSSGSRTITTANGNVGLGGGTLLALSSGSANVVLGVNSGNSISSGINNVIIGSTTASNANSSNSIIIGQNSGTNNSGTNSNNIYINHVGANESNTTRIGTLGSGASQQNRAFLAGITAVTVAGSSVVGVDTNGQLSSLGLGSTGQPLVSNGASSPSFQTLPIAGGGSNATSYSTTNGIVKYNGTSLVTSSATIDASNRMTNTSQPFVYAKVGTTIPNATGDGTGVTIIFNSVVSQQGSAYNSATGIFTIPLTGVYIISSSVSWSSISGANSRCQLNIMATSVLSSQIEANPANCASSSSIYTQGGSAVLLLNTGDTISIQGFVSGGTKTVGIQGDSFGQYSCLYIAKLF